MYLYSVVWTSSSAVPYCLCIFVCPQAGHGPCPAPRASLPLLFCEHTRLLARLSVPWPTLWLSSSVSCFSYSVTSDVIGVGPHYRLNLWGSAVCGVWWLGGVQGVDASPSAVHLLQGVWVSSRASCREKLWTCAAGFCVNVSVCSLVSIVSVPLPGRTGTARFCKELPQCCSQWLCHRMFPPAMILPAGCYELVCLSVFESVWAVFLFFYSVILSVRFSNY